MDLFEQVSDMIAPFVEFQKFVDTYGIVVEATEKETSAKSLLLGGPTFIFKFSLPEFWDIDQCPVDPDAIAKTFKDMMNKSVAYYWKASDPSFTDDLVEFCLKSFKYMSRTRKGETWNRENQAQALADTKKRIAEAKTKINRESEYGEV